MKKLNRKNKGYTSRAFVYTTILVRSAYSLFLAYTNTRYSITLGDKLKIIGELLHVEIFILSSLIPVRGIRD